MLVLVVVAAAAAAAAAAAVAAATSFWFMEGVWVEGGGRRRGVRGGRSKANDDRLLPPSLLPTSRPTKVKTF